MRKVSVFLLVGIADLLLSSLLFTNQQYFSFAAMLSIFLIISAGFAIILLSYHYEQRFEVKRGRNILLILCFYR